MCQANRWADTLIVTPPTHSNSHPPRRAKLPTRIAKTTSSIPKSCPTDCPSRRSPRFITNPTTQFTELTGHFHPSPLSPLIKKSLRSKVCHIKESNPIAFINLSPSIRKAKAISISKHCPTSPAIRRSPRFSKSPTK